IECRDPQNTLPYISVMDFDGLVHLDHYILPEKEWTLTAIQGKKVILKKVSENSPVSPGLWMIDYTNPTTTSLFHQYQYLGILNGYIQMRPQHITSGFELYFSLKDQEVLTSIPTE